MKLSKGMVYALKAVGRGEVIAAGPTREGLVRRGLVTKTGPAKTGTAITFEGAQALERIKNAEATQPEETVKLTFKRIQPGEYNTNPDNQRKGYLIDKTELGWTAYAPTGPAGPRSVIGTFDTLKAAKAGAQVWQDHLDVLAEFPRVADDSKAVTDTIVHALNAVEPFRAGDYTHGFTLGQTPEICTRMVERPSGALESCGEPVKSAIHDPQAYSIYHAELTAALDEWSGKPAKIRLSPGVTARDGQVIPDVELIQLLTLLDHGVAITRSLYQSWRVERTAALATAIDPEKLDRTIRAALDIDLVDYTSANLGDRRVFTLHAAPVHLARMDGRETFCGRRILRAGRDRIRYTSNPERATHTRCVERGLTRSKQAGT